MMVIDFMHNEKSIGLCRGRPKLEITAVESFRHAAALNPNG